MTVKPIVRSSLGSVSLTIKCGKGRSLAPAIFLLLFLPIMAENKSNSIREKR